MKKYRYTWIAICIILLLSACAVGQQGSTAEEPSQAPTWQEQYDLGVRYLSEGNYQEAILAFTAAIEIDPKQAPAYVGRGDAYVKSGETESNLAAAKANFEKAIELDEVSAEAYIGLADIYIRQEDYENAMVVLRKASGALANNQELLKKISEMRATLLKSDNFLAKESFVEFEDLIPEFQSLIKELIDNIGKKDTMIEELLLEKYAPLVNQGAIDDWIETFHLGYKIRLYQGNVGSVLELRQKNGTAYYCRVDTNRTETTRGATQAWNWNGQFESFVYANSAISQTSGYCINGLIDGTVYGYVQSLENSYSYYREYDMGKASEQATREDGSLMWFNTDPSMYETCYHSWISDPNNFWGKW